MFCPAKALISWSRLGWFCGLLLLSAAPSRSATSLPSGFVEETIGGTWNEAVGLTFAADGRMIVWERGGRVWTVENGVKNGQPLLDISEETGAWKDHGLMGLALHPDFAHNGYLYLMYVVDHHHLVNFGTPNYDPSANEYSRATIGRITRYTARAADGFRSVDPASRLVLVGESISNGFPVVFTSHALGSLVFGEDGTLLASCGDGASSQSMDTGNASETYYAQAISEGIMDARHNVGAFRAQMTSTLAGKILRLDPATGDGVSSNPFYDGASPRSARSRIWALGLRNPFRITLRQGTGSHNRNDARPGVLYVGDVGWTNWEELNICSSPGQNFGWPLFEGLEISPRYSAANILNQDAPNPLSGSNGCAQPFFYFRDLVKQVSLGTITWANPCNGTQPMPATVPCYIQTRPAIDWKTGSGPARTGIFTGTNAAVINIGAAGSPVSGPQFSGTCSIGGCWYTNAAFPAQYQGTYFQADYGGQWIKNFVFDANDRPVAARDFASNAGGIVCLGVHPADGSLYYIAWTSTLKRIRYTSGSNQPPVAVVSSDKAFGPGPLTVQFTGSNSRDPESQPLAYRWSFGDGTAVVTNANPTHVFNAPAGVPARYETSLTVTDRSGLSNTAAVVISVNNTPPSVTILSPVDGSYYPLTGDSQWPCVARASDAEQGTNGISYQWQLILHHNTHVHTEPPDSNAATVVTLSPVGCNGETYYYTVQLTVTDAAGLSVTNEARLFPRCPPALPILTWTNPPDLVFGSALSSAQLNATASVPGTFLYSPPAGSVLGPGNNQTLTVLFTPANTNNYAGATANVSINVIAPPSAPGPLTVTLLNPSQASLSWSDTSSNETGFKLERSVDGTSFSQIASLSSNTVSIIDTGLVTGVTYYYRLLAYNAGGGSTYTYPVSATPTLTRAKVNFQPASSPVPAGYLADSGGIFGAQSNGYVYGWNVANPNTVARGSSRSPDARFDTFIYSQKTGSNTVWEIAVPNGIYNVLLVAGDASDSSTSYKYLIEGLPALAGTATSAQRWITGTVSVAVSDGRLTLGNASDATNNRVCFLELSRGGPLLTSPPSKVAECGSLWTFDSPLPTGNGCNGANLPISIVATVTNWNSACKNAYTAVRTWRAEDDCGNTAVSSQMVTVTDTRGPALAGHADKIVECGTIWDFDPPKARAGGYGGSARIAVVGTTTNRAGRCGNTFQATRTWSATDGCGNSNTCSQTITLIDTQPPGVVGTADKIVECGTPWEFDLPVSTSGGCGGTTLSVASTSTNRAGYCGQTFQATRVWRATDPCGNSRTCAQQVLVVDTTPVTMVCADVATCDANVKVLPKVQDLCDANAEIACVRGDGQPIDSAFLPGVTFVTCQANDRCTNIVTCQFRVSLGSEVQAQGPANQTVCLGTAYAVLTTMPSGAGPIRYQWRFNGTLMPGATNNSLLVPNLGAAQSGQYCVEIKGTCNAVTNCATLTVTNCVQPKGLVPAKSF